MDIGMGSIVVSGMGGIDDYGMCDVDAGSMDIGMGSEDIGVGNKDDSDRFVSDVGVGGMRVGMIGSRVSDICLSAVGVGGVGILGMGGADEYGMDDFGRGGVDIGAGSMEDNARCVSETSAHGHLVRRHGRHRIDNDGKCVSATGMGGVLESRERYERGSVIWAAWVGLARMHERAFVYVGGVGIMRGTGGIGDAQLTSDVLSRPRPD